MSRKKIFFTSKLVIKVEEYLKDFDVEIYEGEPPIPREVLKEKVKDVDGLVVLLTDRIDAEILDNAPRLKIVANYAVGYDNIDVDECTRRGIVVTNTPDVLTDATAELAWALVFAVARRIVEAHKYVEKRLWRGWSPTLFLGIELKGKTLGVLGAGRIGQAFALKSAGFGMKVVYYNRRPNEVLEKQLGARKVDLDELLQVSDIISLHLPLTPETYHLIGEREFNLMKPNAIFINTARGKIVDEKALVKVLKERRIYGAGLDVFEFEPRISEELYELDNVVMLPHIGSATVEARTKMAELVVENLRAFFNGEIPPTVVNKELYGRQG
jgi:D-3-phosphoglycerate dehydrogenase